MTALVTSLGQAPPAIAAPPTAQDLASQLKEKGDAAMRAGRFADALFAYRASYDAWPNPRVLFNEARAHEVLGQYPEALEYLERFSREAPPELSADLPGLAQMIADVRAKVAVVEVRSNAAAARVVVRERAITLGKPIYLIPGHATFEASAEGYKTMRKETDLPGGEVTSVDMALEPLAAPPPRVAPVPPPPAAAAAPAPETKRDGTRRVVAASLGGAGVVGLVIAGGLALGAKSKYDDVGGHCAGTLCDSTGLDQRNGARRQGNVATAIGIASLACVAGGVVVWITAPSSLVSRVGIGPTGVSVGGTF